MHNLDNNFVKNNVHRKGVLSPLLLISSIKLTYKNGKC